MFDQAIKQMDNALFSAFSKKGIYNQAYMIDVVLDVDVDRATEVDFVRNAYELTFQRSQVSEVSERDIVEIDGLVYTLTSPVQSDENIIIWAANARSR